MIALVTGAAGFLGSHLAKALVAEGHTVTGIDDLSTGDLANVAPLLESERFRFVEADVCAGLPAFDALHAVFHFASPASPIDYAERPLETLRVNSLGTERCASLALAKGARLIYASTSETYGDPLEHPQRETYWGNVNPIGPRSCYDEAKRYGEALVATFRRAFALDARIVRIFNTYGPHMRRRDGRVVPAFITQALSGEPFTVFGDGSQTRSLCYVNDLVEGILRFASVDSPAHWLVNLGSDEEVTVMTIARTIAELAGVPLRVRSLPLPEDDPKQRRPDLTRVRELLQWRTHTPMAEGLAQTLAWFKTALSTTHA